MHMPPLTMAARRNRGGMPVELQIADGLAPLDLSATDLQTWLQHIAASGAAAGTNLADAQLCVRVCGEQESAALNGTYRGSHKPTNVLSFSADLALPEVNLLGDLAVCWPLVQREARQQDKLEMDHFTHLFVHGVLHLLGFDHEQERQAREMENLEVEILRGLGIADPYQRL